MSVWFEGSDVIAVGLDEVRRAFAVPGEAFVAITRRFPGLTRVELVEQDADSVTIETNEGLMRRSNVRQDIGANRLAIDFDERYEAGSKVTTTSHYSHEFRPSGGGVTHRLVISDVAASGVLGFLYRTFGSSKTGNAMLAAVGAHLKAAAG